MITGMKTLTIRPADVATSPLGGVSPTARVDVFVSYDRNVELSDGTFIPAGLRTPATTDAGGLWSVEVVPSDHASITAGTGVCATVWATVTPVRGRAQNRPGEPSKIKTIQVLTTDPDTVKLSNKEPVVPVPPAQQVIDWQALRDASNQAVTKANTADSKSDTAVATANDAKAQITNAVASQDSATAQNLNTGTSTKAAMASILDRYDIRNYGATTSSTDNRAAIQAAINAASAAGGVVWIPTGTWNVKATTSRTFSCPANVFILGQNRKTSIIRVHQTSGDWAYLFCYSSTAANDNLTIRNLTLDGGTNTSPTTTAADWNTARSVVNSIGANVTIEGVDLKACGVWGIKHVGENLRIRDLDITVDMSWYTKGWFDQSIIWANSMGGRIYDNTFTTKEATTSPFVIQTCIEFQGHRNSVTGNKTAPGSRTRNSIIFTANTYTDPLANFYPGWAKGADDNLIEGNAMTCTRYGVEIWGMVIASPLPMSDNRIRRNNFTIDNTGSTQPGALVSMYIGTPGASGNDGTQTSPVAGLKISDNLVKYKVRRVATVYTSADAGIRLYTEVPMTGVQINGNKVINCGGFGIIGYVADAASGWIDGLDMTGNTFTDVREPVRIVRNVKNWRVDEGNVFEQTQIFATFDDNMIETIASRGTSIGAATIRRNMIRCQPGHSPWYPVRDQGIAQSNYPASAGNITEQQGVQQQAPGTTVTIGASDLVRKIDGTFARATYTPGATLGTLTAAGGGAVTITSVQDAQTMTVSDATNIQPGQSLTLPFNAPFASGSAVVVSKVGNKVRTAANQLAAASGHAWSEAAGASLSYYGAVTAVS